MDIKEIEKRIENKRTEITKIQNRIHKWGDGLRAEDIEFVTTCIQNKSYKAFWQYREANRDVIPSSKDYYKGPNISEFYSAMRDLEDANATLDKYIAARDKELNYLKEDRIQALVDFLEDWGKKVYEWYARNAHRYFELYIEWDSKQAEVESELKAKYTDYFQFRRALGAAKQDFFSCISNFTYDIIRFIRNIEHKVVSYDIREDILTGFIEKEKKAKYRDLCERITSKVGEIKDCSNLSIGNQSGELNGIVNGTKGSVRVNTISAGGWNIQCFHYRVLVNKI